MANILIHPTKSKNYTSISVINYFLQKRKWVNSMIPYSRLFSRGKIFMNVRCGDISGVKFLRMVNKELISNHTPIYFQGENIRE